MKQFKDKFIIGIDHGYGNIKTANHTFKAGIAAFDSEPVFQTNMLTYGGKYYLVGEGHKEFSADKITDEEYFILTVAGIAMELNSYGLTEANVHIAAGLPLKWVSQQKKAFSDYLLRVPDVRFTFNKQNYHIRISGVNVFPQGYAAVAEFASRMRGVNMIADIGNGTMNTLTVINGAPQQGRMFTEKFGTHQCTLAVREQFSRKTQRELDDSIIEEVLINGTADLSDDDLKIITDTAKEYVNGIFRRLREHGYDDKSTTLYITGGDGCLIKNFYKYDISRVFFVDDIRAAAKGYEYMAELQFRMGVSI